MKNTPKRKVPPNRIVSIDKVPNFKPSNICKVVNNGTIAVMKIKNAYTIFKAITWC